MQPSITDVDSDSDDEVCIIPDEDNPIIPESSPPPLTTSESPHHQSRANMITEMLILANRILPEYPLSRPICEAEVTKAFELGDLHFGVDAANNWAKDRGWKGIPSSAAIAADQQLFHAAGYDLTTMAQTRMDALRPHRISKDRIHQHIHPSNPERARLLRLADGMPVVTAPDFNPNAAGTWPKLSRPFLMASDAVEALVHDSHEKQLGFYLTKEMVVQHVPDGHHINAASHVTGTKPEGRMITNCKSGSPSLNSQHTKLWSDEEYGVITHPTIGDIVRMIDQFKASFGDDNLHDPWVLFKMDLKGAYTLLSFLPAHVKLQGLGLSDDLAYFSLGGHFGWTGLPAAFQVITRSIVWEIEHCRLIKACVKMYVDDILGICRQSALTSNIETVSSICRNLLGPTAIAETKTESGRRLSGIGYTIDLTEQLVQLSPRNHQKTLYAFMSVDLEAPVPVKTLQKLGSLASRYGKICQYLRPFTRNLYRSYIGYSQHAVVPLSPLAKLTIRFFRAILAIGLCSTDGAVHLSRSFRSFHRRSARYVVEFDASLTGLGLLFYAIENGIEVPVAHAQVNITCLGFAQDSAYQNTAEFIGGVFAMRGLYMLGMHREPAIFRGDSTSALSWIQRVGVKSDAAAAAAVVFAYQAIFYGFAGLKTEHQAGIDHTLADSRSRQGTLAELGPAWAKKPEIDLQAAPLLAICAPGRTFHTDDDLCTFLADVKEEVRRIPAGSCPF
jgi:hypothetical protein